MELNILQQHSAYRATMVKLLPFGYMNRTELRNMLRRERLKRIRQERFKTNVSMAEALSGNEPDDVFSASFLSQIINGHRGIGDDVADKIEERLGLPQGYLDNPIDAGATLTPEQALIVDTYPTLDPDQKKEWLLRIAQDTALYQSLMDALLTEVASPAHEPPAAAADEPEPPSRRADPPHPVGRIVNVTARSKPLLPAALTDRKKKNDEA